MSSVDKTITNAYYEIEIDPAQQLPLNINMVILSGTKGSTESKDKKILGGRHVAFHFKYEMSSFGKLKKIVIPAEAQKVLAKS